MQTVTLPPTITSADLERVRRRFAVMASLAPKFREVQEAGKQILGDAMAKLGEVFTRVQTEAADEFRRRMQELDATIKAVPMPPLDLPADVASITWPTADELHRWHDDGGPSDDPE